MNYRDRMMLPLLLGLWMPLAIGQEKRRVRDVLGSGISRFVVYYGTQDQPALNGYDIVVLDSDIDPAMVRRIGRTGQALGYLSLGEVHMGRAWAADLQQQGVLLSNHPQWREARYVDLRNPRWKQRVLDELIPAILASGFAGLFLDTLDDAAYLESLDQGRFAGMVDAAVDLVRAIRSRFPQMPIMVNRGYGLLLRIIPEIDMVMGESVHSTFDAVTQSYVHVSPADVRWQLQQLHEARRLKPELKLFSLDYWSPRDPQGIARIYAQAESNGFIPYVATIDLTQIVPRS